MRKQKHAAMMLIILAFLLCMICGCNEQNNPSPTESLQELLEKTLLIDSVSYAVEIATPMLDTTTTAQVWQKTLYLKQQETTVAGNISTTQTIIKRPEGLYRYNEEQQSYEQDPQAILPQPTLQDMATDLLTNQTLTRLGIETIDGKTTTVIQYNPKETGNSTTMTLWIWNENAVPLKAEHITIYEETSIITQYTYTSYSFEEIPDSVFYVE